MSTSRVEAFSDGVIAIIITIMVLELKVPHGDELTALSGLWPVFISYVLSFIYVGIHWNNHHHLFAACQTVDGTIMWANLHLLFWLSLIPFVTGWMGENRFAGTPAALYGFVLMMAAVAYKILQARILANKEAGSALRTYIRGDLKESLSIVLYAIGIALAFVWPVAAFGAYVVVAVMWLVPDKRAERAVEETESA